MIRLILAAVLAGICVPAYAFDVNLTKKEIAACVTPADVAVAVRLWENPVVQEYFMGETAPNEQHRLVEASCHVAAFMHEHPTEGADTDFFTLVEESSIGDLLYGATADTSAWRFGVYVALHELSHGRKPLSE